MSKISWFLKNYSWFYFLLSFFLNPWFSLSNQKLSSSLIILHLGFPFIFGVSSKENILSHHFKRLPSEIQLTVCSIWNSCWLIMRIRKRTQYVFEDKYPITLKLYIFPPIKRVSDNLYHESLKMWVNCISWNLKIKKVLFF